LANLVRLGLTAVPLQIQLFFYTRLTENVVASSNTHLEPQSLQKVYQIVEPDACVGSSTQHALEDFVGGHRNILPQIHFPSVC